MGHTELQQLSSRYASGELDKASYRLQRKQLIDRITAVQQEETQPRPEIQPETAPPPQAPIDSRIRVAAALLALLVTLAMLIYFTLPDG